VPERVVQLRCLEGRMDTRWWMDFRRSREGELDRAGCGFRLEFKEAVWGPFAIGYGAHFGMGVFVPEKED
jgi:CRISPR-associated protein Csb2